MEDLVRQAQSGDPSAVERLLEQIAPSIQRFGQRMCQNTADSEDVLQDTLLNVLGHLKEFEGRSSFTSWVFSLTRSACTRRRRGLKNQAMAPLDDIGETLKSTHTPEQGASERELSRLLESALDRLSEEHREVLLLRDVESLTAPEAADILGISVDALKSRLHRARQALRQALRPVLEPQAAAASASCPDIMQLWSQKLEGDLDALDCAQMEKHLLTCPACNSACSALKTALMACRREATNDVSQEVQAQVKAAVRIWMNQKQSTPPTAGDLEAPSR
ncbi:MAG: sigma-70 family RNA polymerase sigma factor [Polyangiaceae bacterium]